MEEGRVHVSEGAGSGRLIDGEFSSLDSCGVQVLVTWNYVE